MGAKIVYKSYNQNDSLLFPPTLGDLIPESHPVRTVSAVIDRLDITGIESTYKGGGTSSFHPRMLLKVIVYCRLSSRRRAILLWSVSENSPPNRTYTFQRIRLSASICSSNRSIMNLFMTSSTKCNSFPFPCNHVSFPRLFILKILEFTYMVHFQMALSTT